MLGHRPLVGGKAGPRPSRGVGEGLMCVCERPALTSSWPPPWVPPSTWTGQGRQQGSSKSLSNRRFRGLKKKKKKREFLLQKMHSFLEARARVSQFKRTEKQRGCRYQGKSEGKQFSPEGGKCLSCLAFQERLNLSCSLFSR